MATRKYELPEELKNKRGIKIGRTMHQILARIIVCTPRDLDYHSPSEIANISGLNVSVVQRYLKLIKLAITNCRNWDFQTRPSGRIGVRCTRTRRRGFPAGVIKLLEELEELEAQHACIGVSQSEKLGN